VQIGEVTEAWAKAVGMAERKGALVISSFKTLRRSLPAHSRAT
jgi:hypothetical protein